MEQIDYTSPEFWSKAPEGATVLLKDVRDGYMAFAERHETGARAWRANAAGRSQFGIVAGFWKVVAQRPVEASAWNGTGLPPVGTVCEMCDDEGAWYRSTVIANGVDRGVPTAIGQADDTLLYCQEGHHCRPLRTPEQVAAEERDKARTEVLNAMTEAGAADEPQPLWEHRLKVVGEMLDMGFRKIDTSQPSPAEISSDIKQANLNLLADKVLALNGTRVGGIGQFWPAGQNHGGGSMIPVCWRELNELVALAKELKQ